MPFQKGQQKHPMSGRRPGVKNKKKVIKISDFVAELNINIASEIYKTIQTIQDPVQKTKALMEFYSFLDAPVKEPIVEESESEDDPTEISNTELLSLVESKIDEPK